MLNDINDFPKLSTRVKTPPPIRTSPFSFHHSLPSSTPPLAAALSPARRSLYQREDRGQVFKNPYDLRSFGALILEKRRRSVK